MGEMMTNQAKPTPGSLEAQIAYVSENLRIHRERVAFRAANPKLARPDGGDFSENIIITLEALLNKLLDEANYTTRINSLITESADPGRWVAHKQD
jgi:hypothetical protein